MEIALKRIYDSPDAEDGVRILVDRVWPRGMTKKEAAVDLWARAVAPTTELRKFFGHDAHRWEEFRARYREELHRNPAATRAIAERAGAQKVTLLFSARDTEHNNAVVLREWLLQGGGKG